MKAGGAESEAGWGELPLPFQFLAAWVGVWVSRYQQKQIEFLMALNQTLLERVGKKGLRLTDAERRKLAVLGKEIGRKGLQGIACIATPDTILRWYRELVAKKYDGSKRRGPGRPRKAVEIVELVLRMARENTGWGYTRIRGALANVGHVVGRNTIKRMLLERGIDPAPIRKRRYSWTTFIKAHMGAIAGMDFFTVEVMALTGLVRYHVLFVIELKSRVVEIVGIARDPGGEWMKQMARNLVDAEDGFLKGTRYLIADRDPLYTKDFREMLGEAGTKMLRLPPSSPNLNAFAERFVLSIKSECLDRIVPLGLAHLRNSIAEYMKHYHQERNHQGLDNRLIVAGTVANDNGCVQRRERMGGLLSYYHREVA